MQNPKECQRQNLSLALLAWLGADDFFDAIEMRPRQSRLIVVTSASAVPFDSGEYDGVIRQNGPLRRLASLGAPQSASRVKPQDAPNARVSAAV